MHHIKPLKSWSDSIEFRSNEISLLGRSHYHGLKIAALNCHFLADKIIDVKADFILLKCDIICLSETWLKNEDQNGVTIPG